MKYYAVEKLPVFQQPVKDFRFHHWMYGIVLIVISLLISNSVVYAIGLGLFVDEFTYILIQGKTHMDNYSPISLIGTTVFMTLAYLFHEQLFGFI